MRHHQVIFNNKQIQFFHGVLLAGRLIEHPHQRRRQSGDAIHEAFAAQPVRQVVAPAALQQVAGGFDIAPIGL